MKAPVKLLFLLVAIVVSATATEPSYGKYPASSTIPEQYILTNDTVVAITKRVSVRSGDKRAIIFTTLRLGDAEDDAVYNMLQNFCFHLHRNGFLPHTMLITTDEATFLGLRKRGLPAYLDRAFSRRDVYIDRVHPDDTHNREFDVEKHWWGYKFTSLGFRVVYMDSDAVVLNKNLLAPFNHPFKYDVQGLTDWQDLEHPDLDRAYTLNKPCILYRLSPDPEFPWGAFVSESWNLQIENFNQPLDERFPLLPNPCQSTGTWFLEPTPATVAFMAALVDRIAFNHVEEWDQTAWNEILLHFLWGAGDNEPVKYRALPFSGFINYHSLQARQEKGYPIQDTIVLHMGGVHGWEKHNTFESLGLWHGDFRWEGGVVEQKKNAPAGEFYIAGGEAKQWSANDMWWSGGEKSSLLSVGFAVVVTVALVLWRVQRGRRRSSGRFPLFSNGPWV